MRCPKCLKENPEYLLEETLDDFSGNVVCSWCNRVIARYINI